MLFPVEQPKVTKTGTGCTAGAQLEQTPKCVEAALELGQG